VLAALHGQSLKSLNAASVNPVLGITLLSVENSTVLCWLNSWGSYHTGNPDILARFFFFFFRLAFDKSGHRGGREGGGGGGAAWRKPIGLTIAVDRGLWDKARIRRSTIIQYLRHAGEGREGREEGREEGRRQEEEGGWYRGKHDVPALGWESGPCAVAE